MNLLWTELLQGFPDMAQLGHIVIRFTAASLLGGLIGYQRERMGKPAGLRTHILVCLGTVAFVLSCTEAGFTNSDLSRVIQGVLAGIGFIGAGSIIKISEKNDVHGLTTAASIWMTAGIGVSIGLGRIGIAVLTTLCVLFILSVIAKFEHHKQENTPPKAE
jgi:putative Mg2+ transporter-C (MgtC) family protein